METKKQAKPQATEKTITLPLSVASVVLSAYQREKKAQGKQEKTEPDVAPDVIGAVDSLGRIACKIRCFAALFSGDRATIDLLDIFGASLILDNIVDDIANTEKMLIPGRAGLLTGGITKDSDVKESGDDKTK